MQRGADLQAADIGFDILRNVIDRTFEVDGVGDDVDGAAALHAGCGFRALDARGEADTDGGAFAEPHEIHMERKIAHRIEMEVARNHAVLLALDIDVVNRGQEPAGLDAQAQFDVVDRNGHGGLVVAIDHSGNSPGATLCPCGPLAACRTSGRLQFLDGRHLLKSLFSKKLKAASRPMLRRSKPPGVRGLRTWRRSSPKGTKRQGNAGVFLEVWGRNEPAPRHSRPPPRQSILFASLLRRWMDVRIKSGHDRECQNSGWLRLFPRFAFQRIDRFALDQHRDIFSDPGGAGLRLFGVVDPVQDRVAVGAIKRFEKALRLLASCQRRAEILRHYSRALWRVSRVPAPVLFGAFNLAQTRRTHAVPIDQLQGPGAILLGPLA